MLIRSSSGGLDQSLDCRAIASFDSATQRRIEKIQKSLDSTPEGKKKRGRRNLKKWLRDRARKVKKEGAGDMEVSRDLVAQVIMTRNATRS